MAGELVVAVMRLIGPVVCERWEWWLVVGAGQRLVAVVVRQSLSRLWVPHSSFHSA